MKCLSLMLLSAVILAVPAAAAERTKAPVSSVGLIDMAHVFQNYKKFEELRNTLQAEITKSDGEAKVLVERLQQGQEEIKQYTAGSQEYEQREKQLRVLKGEFDAFRAATQRRLARRESEMFKVIYADVTAAVELYAEHKGYTMVLRFNRKGIDEEMNPQAAVATMNKTVIYHQGQNDITEVVLRYLDDKYAKSAGGTPVREAGSSRRVNQ